MNQTRFGPLGQLGLRSRIIAAFGFGSVLVAALLSLTAVSLSRSNLIEQREQLLSERASLNAATLSEAISGPDADVQALLGSLPVAGRPSVLLGDEGDELRPVSLDSRFGATTLPVELRRRVLSGTPAIMRYERDGQVLVAAGAPLDDDAGAYFEVSPLDDVVDSINSLRNMLVAASAAAGLLGGVLGFWASRRVLRPLAEISEVASDVAVGRLDARLAYADWADDPDLAPLVSSFNEMVAALQARIDRDARFASDVSHELRSPLTTFNASLEVLRNARDEMPERAQTALDLLSSDMERFTQLVEDLLEISRFDAGAVRLELDEVLVVETVKMAVRAVSPEKVPVEADESLEGVIMRCDKRRLVRIIANFIDNARKYAEGATRVTLERHAAPTPEDGEDPAEPTETVRIAVEDAGPGVAEDDRERIFDRFNRGGQGGSRGTDLGTGLGLALAAEHAHLQGGRVWVESRPDGEAGARFVVELPLIEASEEPDEPSLDEAPPTGAVDAVVVDPELVATDGPAGSPP